MSTTSAMVAPSSSGAADLSAIGAAAQGLGARIQAAASPENTLAMPFQGSAPLTQSFGPTPYLAEPAYDGYSHFHTGLDYGLPLGTAIDAAAGGTVVAAGWDTTGFGNRVIVDHGNGVRTLYGHLQKVEVQPGDVVAAGQEIGLSGSDRQLVGSPPAFRRGEGWAVGRPSPLSQPYCRHRRGGGIDAAPGASGERRRHGRDGSEPRGGRDNG